MKKLISIAVISLFLSGCATKTYLPYIPKDMEATNLEINISSPWGGTTMLKCESYKASQ